MAKLERILIVVPARNEAANLPHVLREIRAQGGGYDILVVDDASADATAMVAKQQGAEVLRHPHHRGYGAALVSGYRVAVARGYDALIQCDADGQHDPDYFPRLLEKIEAGYDVVIGSRMLTRGGYRPGAARLLGIHFFARLGSILSGTAITDPTSGFIALNRRAAAYLIDITPADYPDLGVRIALLRAGFSVCEVPVGMRPRRSGRSMTSGLTPLVYVPKMFHYLLRAYTRRPDARESMMRPDSASGSRRRVLLANPPTGLYIREDRCQTPVRGIAATLRPPIDLAYMAATARQQGAVAFLRDYPAEGLGEDRFREDLLEIKPQVLVLSTISPTLQWDLGYCRVAKQTLPEVLTVVKGAEVSVRAEEVLQENPALDVVIRGESEIAAGEIAAGRPLSEIAGLVFRTPEKKIIRNPSRPFLEDPDRLPFPARDLLRNRLYFRPDTRRPQTTIQAAWGCPYGCSYCLAPLVSGRKVRRRSPENILAEIRECVQKHRIYDFYFRADTFTLERRWVMELCRLIRDSGLRIHWGCNSRVDTLDGEMLAEMRRAGCWIVGLGVESGSDEILRLVHKGATVDQARRAVALCRQAGIKAYAFFMLGFPWETEETAGLTIELMKTIGADYVELSHPVPFPGTELARLVDEEHLLEAPLLGHDHSRPVIRPFAMSRERLSFLWRKALLGFYTHPASVWRMLSSVRSPREAANYLIWGGEFFWRIVSLPR